MGITLRFFVLSFILKIKNLQDHKLGPGITDVPTAYTLTHWQADRRPLLAVAIFLLILRPLNERSALNFEKYEFPKRQV